MPANIPAFITKREFDVRCSINRDNTFQVSVSPGLLTTVPPLLDGRISSQRTVFGADLKENETLVYGNFGSSETARVSLYFFNIRHVQTSSFIAE